MANHHHISALLNNTRIRLYPLLLCLLLGVGFTINHNVNAALPASVKAVAGFKLEQYLGTWYEIARLDHAAERNLINITATYQARTDGGINVINRGYNAQQQIWQETTGKAYFAGSPNIASLKMAFLDLPADDYHVIILDKNYYNFAVVSDGKNGLWILSRTPQLAYPIKQELISEAKKMGFATENLIFVEQNDKIPDYKAGQHVVHE